MGEVDKDNFNLSANNIAGYTVAEDKIYIFTLKMIMIVSQGNFITFNYVINSSYTNIYSLTYHQTSPPSFMVQYYYGSTHYYYSFSKQDIDNGVIKPILAKEFSSSSSVNLIANTYIKGRYMFVTREGNNYKLYYSTIVNGSYANMTMGLTSNNGVNIISKNFINGYSFTKNDIFYILGMQSVSMSIGLEKYEPFGIIIIRDIDDIESYNIKTTFMGIPNMLSHITETPGDTNIKAVNVIDGSDGRIIFYCEKIFPSRTIYFYFTYNIFLNEYDSVTKSITFGDENIIYGLVVDSTYNQTTFNSIFDYDVYIGSSEYLKKRMVHLKTDNVFYLDCGSYIRNEYMNKNNLNRPAAVVYINKNINQNCITYIPDAMYYQTTYSSSMGSLYYSHIAITTVGMIIMYYRTAVQNTLFLTVPFYGVPMIKSGKGYIKAKV